MSEKEKIYRINFGKTQGNIEHSTLMSLIISIVGAYVLLIPFFFFEPFKHIGLSIMVGYVVSMINKILNDILSIRVLVEVLSKKQKQMKTEQKIVDNSYMDLKEFIEDIKAQANDLDADTYCIIVYVTSGHFDTVKSVNKIYKTVEQFESSFETHTKQIDPKFGVAVEVYKFD